MSPDLWPSICHDVKQYNHAYACSPIKGSNVHLSVVGKTMPFMSKSLDIDTDCVN